MKKITLLGPAMRYVLLIASYQPVNQALAQYTASQNQQGLGALAVQYSDELIVVACIFLLVLCSIIGVFYKTPLYGGKPIPLPLKVPICVAGGFCAFLYCLHVDKALTLITPCWVGGMSFIAPAIIHLIHAVLVKKFGMRFGVDEALLEQLEAEKAEH